MANIIEGIDASLIENQKFSEAQKEFLTNRWLHEVSWFARATRRSRRLYFLLSVASIFSASLTSVVSSASALSEIDQLKSLVALLSIITLLSIGLFGLYKPGEYWRLRSLALERLKNEGRMFLASIGPYKNIENGDEAFELFFTEIQDIVSNYKTAYFSKKPYKPKTN
jgi:hypothetical protein